MIGDGAYPSLLQGVSQQIVQNRIEGQLTAQTNMLSDIVTGLRRRPGTVYKQKWSAETNVSLHSTYLELGDTGYHLFINPAIGSLRVYDEDFVLVHETFNTYLEATSASSIRSVTQAGYTWFLNTERTPDLGPVDTAKQDPALTGWFNVLTGAYSKAYGVTVSTAGFSKTYTYNTPTGASAGDVALSVPEYITTRIVQAMTADTDFTDRFNVYAEGSFVFVVKKTDWAGAFDTLKISSSTGALYMKASNLMVVPLTTDLPANLPIQGNGVIMAVGNNPSTYAYYKWHDADGAWKETGSFDSIPTLINMPQRLKVIDAVFTYETPEFEGRLAGNAENNPYSAFLTFGITGMSAYQGRLVLLAGGYCCLSASNRPLRFMRSTVADLRDDDPIEISAGAIASASFRYAIPFNKDLVLISAAHQAVIPAGNSGITPKNAMVVLSSTESVGINAEPQVMGRTLMYSTAVSPEFYGLGEMLPSQYTNSQYSANNLTSHIPRYVAGSCRSICSNSGVSSGYFLSSIALREVLVNEYLWAGDERVQNAWHKWNFNQDILSVHSAKGMLVFTFAQEGDVLITTLDTRTASYQQQGFIPAFADMLQNVAVVANKFTLPLHLRKPADLEHLRVAQSSGELAGEPVGIESIDTNTWEVITVRSFPEGSVSVGWAITSEVTPSTALIRDKEGRPILTANTNILRYMVNVQNTGEFQIETRITGYDNLLGEDSALLWSSSELGLGQKKAVAYGTVNVPVRAPAFGTETTLRTDGTRELNVVSIEYTLRGVLKRKRI